MYNSTTNTDNVQFYYKINIDNVQFYYKILIIVCHNSQLALIQFSTFNETFMSIVKRPE